MAGDVRRAVQAKGIPVCQQCAIPACERCAIASCFECERFCCERHLSAVSLVTATSSICVHVCPACLHRYRADPEIQPLLTHVATRFLVD